MQRSYISCFAVILNLLFCWDFILLALQRFHIFCLAEVLYLFFAEILDFLLYWDFDFISLALLRLYTPCFAEIVYPLFAEILYLLHCRDRISYILLSSYTCTYYPAETVYLLFRWECFPRAALIYYISWFVIQIYNWKNIYKIIYSTEQNHPDLALCCFLGLILDVNCHSSNTFWRIKR